MALVVDRGLDRRPMARTGGTTAVTFVARAQATRSALRALFTIRAAFPYAHSDPTDPNAPKSKWGRRRAVELAPRSYKTTLELVCTGDCSEYLFVTLDVKIYEVDGNGARARDDAWATEEANQEGCAGEIDGIAIWGGGGVG